MPAIRPPRLPVRPVRRGSATGVTPEEAMPEPSIITGNGIRWIHIPKPRHHAQKWLEQNFEFHPLDYEDIYSRNQRPKVDRYDDYLFVVLQFPRYDRDRERLNVVELDLFAGPDYVVTLPDNDLEPIDSLFARCWESEEGSNCPNERYSHQQSLVRLARSQWSNYGLVMNPLISQ